MGRRRTYSNPDPHGDVQIKGQILFKGEIITKMQKWDGII
jgi:hypothetical protein